MRKAPASACLRNSCRRCLIWPPSSFWCCCRAREPADRRRRQRLERCSYPIDEIPVSATRRGAALREKQSTRQYQEKPMRKILIAATAVMLATGASLFNASGADKLKVEFIYLGPCGY